MHTTRYVSIIRIALFIAFFFPNIAVSQIFPAENGASLKGVTSFDAKIMITNWLDVTLDQAQFERNAQSALELALRRDGVIVDVFTLNYLFCSIKAAGDDNGLIFYGYEIQYFDYSTDGLHTLLWNDGGIVTVGRANFTAESVAQDCVNAFSNEWLKQNPK